MREMKILYFALGVLCVISIGAVSLHDDGIEFPDGSFQETASMLPAAFAVQGRVGLSTLISSPGSFCTDFGTLYNVPNGKRLVVEWMSVQTSTWDAATHPVDVSAFTYDGSVQVYHPIVRIEDPQNIGESFFWGNRWSGPVTLYSEGGAALQVRMCQELELEGEGIGFVSFSGYLIDV